MKASRFVVGAAALVVVAGMCADVDAQGRGRGPGGPGGRGGFFPGGGGQSFELLADENVRKELEIVDEQVEKLTAIRDEAGSRMREEMRGMFEGLRDLPEEERRAKFTEIREKMQEKMEEIRDEVNSVLLPHQVTRLAQLQNQRRMQRGGTSQALIEGPLAEELNLSDDQKEELNGLREEVEKEYREQIAKIRKKLQDKLLRVLSTEQRAKFEELIGEPFEFSNDGRGIGGGDRRGGPGGPGGDRRGGPGGRGGERGGDRPQRPE